MEFQDLEEFSSIIEDNTQLNLSTQNLDLNSLNIQNLEQIKDKLKDFLKMNLEKLKMHKVNDEGISESTENQG